jgi:hypothetical protein
VTIQAPLSIEDMMRQIARDEAQRIVAPLLAKHEPELWDAAQVRNHLGIADRTLAKYQVKPGFPRRVGGAQRRWKADEIRAYRQGDYASCPATSDADR